MLLYMIVFEDNALPNRLAELLFKVCNEQGVTMKQLLRAGVKCLMKGVSETVEEISKDVITKAFKNKEAALPT